ncbi:DUF6103 family protein [Desulfosporosinus metallidurans]|uniref:Uncharacterized protein n=1 Tax=Desulfosporosinus metallidurans TaxID=1888891 RepID=A0A1Q8QVJ6_9FIRM|nr:DUF6103 family protein [Desulfosporosinus metallidurans]OLN31355.1 hypothetical protein DSOL_2694 [Desulfosporosinus metallidurans]
MKKATLQISFDSEKLGALKQYMAKKEASIETELDEVMQKLYEKNVPAAVREYIESREADDQTKSARPSRPAEEQKNAAEDEQ